MTCHLNILSCDMNDLDSVYQIDSCCQCYVTTLEENYSVYFGIIADLNFKKKVF